MKTELKITPRDLRSLRGRVSHLGVDIRNIKRVEVEYADPSEGKVETLEVWNGPKKRNSVAILTRLARDLEDEKGVMGSDAAYETLRLFGGKFVADSTMHEGRHPVIDLMRRVEAREIPYAQVRVVEHEKRETLPDEKIQIFKAIAEGVGNNLPAYIHFEKEMYAQLDRFMGIKAPFGLTIRYAMKANSLRGLIERLNKRGAKIDASTINEWRRARVAGVRPEDIRITAAQIPLQTDLIEAVNSGSQYTACSLMQLVQFGENFRGRDIGIRFNIGISSGWTPQCQTGGAGSPFGIYGRTDAIKSFLRRYDLKLRTFHYHIGSGSDPQKQKEAIARALELVKEFPSVTTVDVGGGVKVGRMEYEKDTDILELGTAMAVELKRFKRETGRKIHLEVEPGTALIAKSGYVLAVVEDWINNLHQGPEFLRIGGPKGGAGMNMLARPTMYGAQHPIVIVPRDNSRRAERDYAVFGTCCESGDCMTPRPGKPESIDTRRMLRASPGDSAVVCGAGAYGDSMAPHHYNTNLMPMVYLVTTDGNLTALRRPEKLDQFLANEREFDCGKISRWMK